MTHESPHPRQQPEPKPAPGDLFVLRVTADLPVEWAVLERGSGGRYLAVPADAGPPAGTADVVVPAGDPAGPLALRCRFSVWLEATLLDPELRTGALGREALEDARLRVRQIESGDFEGSPLAEEVDVDPEYQDWIRDVTEKALNLVTASPEKRERPRRRFPWYGARLLAAAFATVAVGLFVWVQALQNQLQRERRPQESVSAEVEVGNTSRGTEEVHVPKGMTKVSLILSVDSDLDVGDETRGYFEIRDRNGKQVHTTEVSDLGAAVTVILDRSYLPDGTYEILLWSPSHKRLSLESDYLTVQTDLEP